MASTFQELTPQNFSYNSPLGWCPACQGLGVERGTGQSVIISNPNLSLNDRAVSFWPDPKTNRLFARMLQALTTAIGIDPDRPWYQLTPLQQRAVLYGSEQEITVPTDPETKHPGFRFVHKGIYPTIDEATRVSYTHRALFQDLVGERPCSVCGGDRMRDDAAAVRLNDTTLPQLSKLPLTETLEFLKGIKLTKEQKKVAGDLLSEAIHRLEFLVEVGLHYLTLDRSMPTLSGGESQRIRLAGQIGRALTGVLYVLDEPTIGLHPRDNGRLIGALHRLRDLGNTVVLVEHDREVLEAADRLYDFGPGSGRNGGRVTAEGTPAEIESMPEQSLTGSYLSGAKGIPVPETRRLTRRGTRDEREEPENVVLRKSKRGKPSKTLFTDEDTPTSPVPSGSPLSSLLSLPSQVPAASALPLTDIRSLYETPPGGHWIELTGARQNNLRQDELHIPSGAFTVVTGLSGSGKSSLIMETLARAVARKLTRSGEAPGPHDDLRGTGKLNKVILVDQSPLGTTPASNPATYTGVWEPIRDLFTRLPEAKIRGFKPARFSFNRPGGRCDDCEGMGQKKIEMHFLPDVWVECTTCRGKRFNQETLTVQYKDHSIADVLNLSIGQALELFGNIPKIRAPLATLAAIGLDYLTLGQSAATLSGGEAQRVKLAAELARPNNGQTLYILDEPTTGLHFDDISKLMKVLMSLVEQGNTVVVIEHNLDVIKTADWVIDLGPEAGVDGGWIVAEGTPEDVVVQAKTYRMELEKKSEIRNSKSEKKSKTSQEPSFEFRASDFEFAPQQWALARREKYLGQTKRPVPIRSWTGELLTPIIENETRGEIEIFRAEEAAKKQSGDIDLRHVGKDTAAPWQTDGRAWHTRDRISHTGKPCRWEGRALELVIDALAQRDELAPVNWNHRSVVEVMAAEKAGGWFLHAQTGDEWLLTLKFRVKKGTFDEAALQNQLPLKPLDQLDELPVYGRGDRVKVKNIKGPFQEVTITVHWAREIDTPAFQKFLASAVNSYRQQSTAAALVVGDLAPWKVLGRKWHLSRKGFPSAKRVDWDAETLDQLFTLIESIAKDSTTDWGGKQTVTWTRPGESKPAIEVNTKRRTSIDLELYAPAGTFGLGQIATLGETREVDTARDGRQVIRIGLVAASQVSDTDLKKFLKQLWSI